MTLDLGHKKGGAAVADQTKWNKNMLGGVNRRNFHYIP